MNNYESILLELMSRVQKLELEVKELKSEKNIQNNEVGSGSGQSLNKVSYTQRTKDYIKLQMDKARENGQSEIILKAGDIQRELTINFYDAIHRIKNAGYKIGIISGGADTILYSLIQM